MWVQVRCTDCQIERDEALLMAASAEPTPMANMNGCTLRLVFGLFLSSLGLLKSGSNCRMGGETEGSETDWGQQGRAQMLKTALPCPFLFVVKILARPETREDRKSG